MGDTSRKPRRQRAILSCNDCRRRKLKCDRLSPCNRCIKGGIADSCAYGSQAYSLPPEELQERPIKRQRRIHSITNSATVDTFDASESEPDDFDESQNAQSSSLDKEQFDQLECNIARLQQHFPNQDQPPKDQVEFLANSPDLKGVKSSTNVMGMLKGRSYGTHFYGPSSASSIAAHFPELRAFMKEAYTNSTARGLSQTMKASEDQARLMRPHRRVLTVHKLRNLLPDRLTVDTLLQKYFDTFETTFRIIHVPTFKAAYRDYWETKKDGENDEMDAIILAILACTICTSTHKHPRYNHAGSNFHSKAVVWIRTCEAWLKRQSNKHRSLATLQVRCLRLLALATTSLKVKEYYQEVQAHVALMRSAGMHRDPSIFGTRCSAFEGEMRRRLWATTVELELQASIDKGTCSSLYSHDYDCAPPRNIDDIDLIPSMSALPHSRNTVTYTDTSFLHIAMQTFECRNELSSKVNSLKEHREFDDILKSEDAIRKCLREIPRWTNSRAIQARALLDLQLRQFLVIVHASRAVKYEFRTQSDCRYSMMTALEAAAKTIDLHYNMIKASNYALILTRNDYFRATLLICHIAYYAKRANDTMISRIAKLIFDESVEKSLRLQEERAMRPGRGSEYFWYISAAISLVGMQFNPSQSDTLKRQAMDRVAKLLYRVLSLQDDPSDETLASEVFLEFRPPTTTVSGMNGLHDFTDSHTAESFADAGLHLEAFDLGDTPDWMLDDLWLFNVPPLDLSGQANFDNISLQ